MVVVKKNACYLFHTFGMIKTLFVKPLLFLHLRPPNYVAVFSFIAAMQGSVTMTTGKLYKHVCMITNQPDTKSNHNPNTNLYATAKQHTIVNIQLKIVTCPMHPEKFMLLRRFYDFPWS